MLNSTDALSSSLGRTDPKEDNLREPATDITTDRNARFAEGLPPEDPHDAEEARHGFIACVPRKQFLIKRRDGKPFPAWDLEPYGFLEGDPPYPPSVNPSLWRIAKLNFNYGLFKVCDGVYQVRGYDVSNMTIIECVDGVIVIDPLSSRETAAAAIDLYRQHVRKAEVKAVIYTHSHVDHYGGVRGVLEDSSIPCPHADVIAPQGFMDAVASENVFAGTAMSRRATYQYGLFVAPGETGEVSNGLGVNYSRGEPTLITPNVTISQDYLRKQVHGVTIEYKLVSGTEAPSEMTLYFPDLHVLNSAEIACPLLHNVLTLRGAQVRDAKKWAMMLDDLLSRYVLANDHGNRTDYLLAQHNWPRIGSDRAQALLEDQRDLYELLHDQTLRRMNHGETGVEIAEDFFLPPGLSRQWYCRDYYGTLSHNVKAIYQRYLGWYDGNPANLHPLPPVETATRLVRYMGGAAAVLEQAKADFDRGDYRWVAQVMSQVVFADPDNTEAKDLEARALEQLGYQAESGIWRNWYLSGAFELRHGHLKQMGSGTANSDAIESMSVTNMFDYWGVRLNPEKLEVVMKDHGLAGPLVFGIEITAPAEAVGVYTLRIRNAALTYRGGWPDKALTAGLKTDQPTLGKIVSGALTYTEAVKTGRIKVLAGSEPALGWILTALDTFDMAFDLVTP